MYIHDGAWMPEHVPCGTEVANSGDDIRYVTLFLVVKSRMRHEFHLVEEQNRKHRHHACEQEGHQYHVDSQPDREQGEHGDPQCGEHRVGGDKHRTKHPGDYM